MKRDKAGDVALETSYKELYAITEIMRGTCSPFEQTAYLHYDKDIISNAQAFIVRAKVAIKESVNRG
jgi:hypothetical protein